MGVRAVKFCERDFAPLQHTVNEFRNRLPRAPEQASRLAAWYVSRRISSWTRTGPDHLAYDATIEDPRIFSRPWKMRLPLYRRVEPNIQLLDYECQAYLEAARDRESR